MKVLLTGGTGLLGRSLTLLADRPSHAELDIRKPIESKPYDLIVHCAAYTDVELAETNRRSCFNTNVSGTLNLLDAYPTTPFVYISSEYAHAPVNFYSLTKSMAEQLVTTHPNYLIIRTLFKERPWKYPFAFKDKFTLGDYVDIIAGKIEHEIENWDRKSKMIYVGTGRKSYYELALQTNPDVKPNSIKDIKGVKIPSDYK